MRVNDSLEGPYSCYMILCGTGFFVKKERREVRLCWISDDMHSAGLLLVGFVADTASCLLQYLFSPCHLEKWQHFPGSTKFWPMCYKQKWCVAAFRTSLCSKVVRCHIPPFLIIPFFFMLLGVRMWWLEHEQPPRAMRWKPHADNNRALRRKSESLTLCMFVPTLDYLPLDFLYLKGK